MEDSEINQLPAGSTVTGTEAIPADQGTKTVYLTPLQITDFAASEIKTIENKTINLSDNALSGTFAEFNASCSDNDFLGVNPRVYSTVYAASFTFNINHYDVGIQSGMTGNTNVQALTGTPASFREVILAFKDDGTSRTITWDPVFVAENVNLPTATTVGEHLYVFLRYNSSTTNWGCVGVNYSSSGGGGSGTVNSGSANELAYYASNGTTVSGLATQADSVLVTNASGTPSILATLPTVVQDNITRTGTLTSGATGSGFTVALGTSTVTGVLPTSNTDAKIKGTIPATNNCIVRSNGTADTVKADTGFTFDGSVMMVNTASGIVRLKATGSPQTMDYQIQNSAGDLLASFNTVVNTGAVSVGGRASGYFTVLTSGNSAERWRIDWANGCFSNTGSDGASWIHLKAGTSTIAPIRLTSAALKTSSNAAGDIQFLTDKLYVTITTGTSVKEITLNDTALSFGTIPVATTNGRLTDGPITVSGGNASVSGNLIITSPTKGIEYRSGANQRVGTANLSVGTVTVSNTTVTANTLVKHFRVTPGSGIQGHISYTKINSTSFTLNSSEATDDGIIGYELIELI